MRLEKIQINKLNPSEYNPRIELKDGDKEYEKLKKSIQEFGLVDPVIINKDYTIIAGHQRFNVLKNLGYTQIECVVLDLNKTKEKALNIALNSINGEWDFEKLNTLLEELENEDFDTEFIWDKQANFDDIFESEFTNVMDDLRSEKNTFGVTFQFKNEYKELVDDKLRELGKDYFVNLILSDISGEYKNVQNGGGEDA